METQSDTRDITSVLKGFAISAVLINHYVNHFVSDQFLHYANGIISIFFVLSGYGIHYSLQNTFNARQTNLPGLLVYFYKRTIRIVPLYWLSLFGMSYFYEQLFPYRVFLLDPLTESPNPYWFVRLLAQCYVIAPFFYLLTQKFKIKAQIMSVGIFLLLAHAYLLYFVLTPQPMEEIKIIKLFIYRFFFLGHIGLFMLGMLIPPIISNVRQNSSKRALASLSFILFIAFIHYTRMPNMLIPHSEKYFSPLFILCAFVFCLLMIITNPKLPIRKVFSLLGNYSYSLYLFHIPFYIILAKLGLMQHGPFQSTMLTILFFPLFLIFCITLEKTLDWTIKHIHQLKLRARSKINSHSEEQL